MFMPVKVTPSLHDRVDMSSHAHPSPVSPPRNDQTEQYLRDLLAGVAFDVESRRLATSYKAPPQSMRDPQRRQSEYKPQAINHLDVISTWKETSNAQALELTLWDRKFQQCLLDSIRERLRSTIEHPKPTVAAAEVSAYTITRLPDNVRFERTSRWDIKIDVVETRPTNVATAPLTNQDVDMSTTPCAPSYSSTPMSNICRDNCKRALALVAMRHPETVPQLALVVRELGVSIDIVKYERDIAYRSIMSETPTRHIRVHEPQPNVPNILVQGLEAAQSSQLDKELHAVFSAHRSEHATTSPKKRKERAVSGAPNQALAWNGFGNDHDMKLKRRKLEQAEDPTATLDAMLAGDLHRMAYHLDVADPSVEQDVKTVADALRMLLKCIEKVEPNDQDRRDMVYRLSGPVMAAIDIVHAKQLSELKQATKKMDELNDNASLKNKIRETRQLPTPQSRKMDKLHYNATAKPATKNLDKPNKNKMRAIAKLPPPPPRLCFESDYSSSASSSNSDNTYTPYYLKHNATTPVPSPPRLADLFQQQIQKNYREFEEKALRKSGDEPATKARTDTVGDMDFERIFLGDSDEEGGWGSSSSPSGSDGSGRGHGKGDGEVGGVDKDTDGDAEMDVDGLSEDMDGLEVEVYVDEMEKKDGVTMEKRLGNMGFWDGNVS